MQSQDRFLGPKKTQTNKVFIKAQLCPVDDPILLGFIHESVCIVHFDAPLKEGGKGELIYCLHTVKQKLCWTHLYVISFVSLRQILKIITILQWETD